MTSISGINSFLTSNELRSVLLFSNVQQQISDITQRIVTGKRINSGKDDPGGLLASTNMLRDIKGLESAKKNVSAGQEMLNIADKTLANLTLLLTGDINSSTQNGIIGLLYNDSLSADYIRQQVNDYLDMIEATAGSANYGGKKLLDGSFDYKINNLDTTKVSNVNIRNASGQKVDITILTPEQKASLWTNDNDVIQLLAAGNVVVNIAGSKGQAKVTFNQGEDISAVAAEVNAKTAQTGVSARLDGGKLFFETADAGASAALSVQIGDDTVESILGFQDTAGHWTNATNGKDITATVNGQAASKIEGRNIVFSSGGLDFSATLSAALQAGQTTTFTITGGGSVFQIGKDVTAENRYAMTLSGMSLGHLGGKSGVMNQLRTLDYSNEDDKNLARKIVNEAQNMVVAERTKIGIVQKAVLEPAALRIDTAMTDTAAAEAGISDADVVLEGSKLNRANLLAQNTMNAILFYRNFQQWTASMLLG